MVLGYWCYSRGVSWAGIQEEVLLLIDAYKQGGVRRTLSSLDIWSNRSTRSVRCWISWKLANLWRNPNNDNAKEILSPPSFTKLYKDLFRTSCQKSEIALSYLKDISLMLSLVSAARDECIGRQRVANQWVLLRMMENSIQNMKILKPNTSTGKRRVPLGHSVKVLVPIYMW